MANLCALIRQNHQSEVIFNMLRLVWETLDLIRINVILVFFFSFCISFTVGTFVQRLLFGYTGDDGKVIPMVFPPTVEHLRRKFEQRHGYRGQYLIEQLGNGDFRYTSGYMPCLSCKHWTIAHRVGIKHMTHMGFFERKKETNPDQLGIGNVFCASCRKQLKCST